MTSAGAGHLAADHAAHPADRLRRPGRGRRSAAPRADRGRRDDRHRRRCSATSRPVDSSINEVILLIGLAVGVDYSMFYLRREREEREAGRSEEASLAAAAATSGRAVLVSGLTVMLAMAGMYLGGAPTFASFATGTIIVVAVAMVGSLTVLPAILAWLGDRIEKGGVPIIKNQPWNAGESARVVADPQSGPAASRRLGRARRRACWSSWRSPRFTSIRRPRASSRCLRTWRDQDLQQDPGSLPRWGDPRRRRGQRRRRHHARGQRRRRGPAQQQAAASPLVRAADHDADSPDRRVEEVDIPLAGDGSDSKSNDGAGRASRTS